MRQILLSISLFAIVGCGGGGGDSPSTVSGGGGGSSSSTGSDLVISGVALTGTAIDAGSVEKLLNKTP